MKTTVLAVLVLSLPALAGAAENMAAVPATNPAFERLKALEGTWTGTSGGEEGGKPVKWDVTVVYKVTAGGSALQETLFPGTPHEMVTMYHMDGDQLVLTHYCAAGNQPHMKLEPGRDPNVLSFKCAGGTNMKEADMHMHSAQFTFVDADHLKGIWTSMKEGKPAGDAVFALARKK